MKKQKNAKRTQRHNEKTIKGITLIALVITIVVLLILAAVSITAVFGDNGLLKQASEASVKTKLSTLEEMVNQKYLANLVQSQINGTSEEIVLEELIEEQGYELETRTTGEAEITGIKLSKEQIQMAPNSEETITVTLEMASEEEMQYYVKVDEKYYKVTPSNNGITIERTETKLTEEGSKDELTAEVKAGSGTSVTVKSVEGKVITLQSGETVGATTITVKYGSYTKECVVTVAKKPTESSEASPSVTITTAYGKVDVIWLNTSNGVIPTPNAPILTANGETMTKVKWTEKETVGDDNVKWEEDAEEPSDSEWYSYAPATGKDNSMGSRWANAKTRNGDYFVWIPRFAYRITYYDKDWTTDATAQVTGYYDGLGMWNAEGELKYKLDTGVTTIDYGGEKYIVHPAFETNLDMGGWSEDLAGFWFAKYEMSGSTTALASKPQVASLTNINIGAMYQACRNAKYGYTGKQETFTSGGETVDHTSYMNSHLVKNSEWGAVALLTQSAYGRNGHQIDINNYWSSDKKTKTGVGAGGTDTSSSSAAANEYNTEIGAHASTTGNIYGIYDISGGAVEYTASYDKLGGSFLTGYGLNLTKEAKSQTPKTEGGSDYEYISTKYATAYENGTGNYDDNATVYKVSKTGDTVKEVRTGSTGWFRDYSYVCRTSYPFFGRGGDCGNGAGAGVFYSSYGSGDSGGSHGFRAVLCP